MRAQHGDAVRESIVNERSGSVLGKGCIHKMYFFPGQRTGWYYRDSSGLSISGQQACRRRSLSALHVEVDGLIWAMSCLREREIKTIRIETDCSNLINIMEEPLDWSAFKTEIEYLLVLRSSFDVCNLCLILRL